MTLEDFNFSEEELRLYMAQYDALQDIIKRDYLNNITEAEFEKIEYDEKIYKKAMKKIKNAITPYLKPYYEMYESEANRVINNMYNVITSCGFISTYK